MVVLFNSPNNRNWLYIFLIYLSFIIAAFWLSGCKSRKVEKDYLKVIDKSEQNSVVRKLQTNKDSTTATIKTGIKESAQSIETFDEVETTKIYKDSTVIVKKSKKQRLINTDKNKTKDLKIITNNYKTNFFDSIGNTKNDIKEIKSFKQIESKSQPVKMWIGFALFLIIVGGAIIIYFKKK